MNRFNQEQLKEIRLYNTMSRSIELLKTRETGTVKLYCCGPTVYNYQHIGNLRAYVFEDLLVRSLKLAGYEVQHVMNITDVGHLASDADEGEDKMVAAARREKKRSEEIAEFYTQVFLQDCEKVNINRPNVICKATDHIKEMIELIQRLEERGMTYLAGGNVYFDIERFAEYGKLARLDLAKLKAGARIDVDDKKRNPHDFALWFTKSKFEEQEMQWDSPWGRGYPGWHIECSAMAMKYLGEEFDIHCGGIDHISVHHTNEIAQAEGATGKPWVSVWMHVEFLVFSGEKMSKSAGTFIRLKDLEDRGIAPLAYRLFLLGAHYRSQLSFNWEALEGSNRALTKLYSAVAQIKAEAAGEEAKNSTAAQEYAAAFESALLNDLNTPKALAILWSVLQSDQIVAADKLRLLTMFDSVLGLGLDQVESYQELSAPEELQQLLVARNQARKDKNWAQADALRKQISDAGYSIVDEATGSRLVKS